MESLKSIRELGALMTKDASWTGDYEYDGALRSSRGPASRRGVLLTDSELETWMSASAVLYKRLTGSRRARGFVAGRSTPLGFGPDVEFVTYHYAAQFIAFTEGPDSVPTSPLRMQADPRFYCVRIAAVPSLRSAAGVIGQKLAQVAHDTLTYMHIDYLPDLVFPTLMVWQTTITGKQAQRAYGTCSALARQQDVYGVGAKYRQYRYEQRSFALIIGLQVIVSGKGDPRADSVIKFIQS